MAVISEWLHDLKIIPATAHEHSLAYVIHTLYLIAQPGAPTPATGRLALSKRAKVALQGYSCVGHANCSSALYLLFIQQLAFALVVVSLWRTILARRNLKAETS